MSAIVNDRDVLLQAASPRLATVNLPTNVQVPAVKSVRITAPSQVFQVNTSGVASPTSILLTANLTQISGTVTWSVISGTATLTGSGATRTLSYANMSTDSVTIQASVTDGGTTYTDSFTIAKVRDGTNGTNGSNGSNGARGSLAMTASGTSWSDTTANNTVTTVTGSSTKVFGDSVTISGTGFAQTKRWDGSAWVDPGQIFNGNMFVTGTITTDRLVANAATAASSAVDFTQTFSVANGALTSGQTSPIVTSNTMLSFTSTGAPVKFVGSVRIQVVCGNTADVVWITAYLQVDGADTDSGCACYVPVIQSTNGNAYAAIPVVWRGTPAAGSHTFKIKTNVQPNTKAGVPVSVGANGAIVQLVSGLVEENKV